MRSWKCRITAASLPGIEMASASPSAVAGKYLAVWEKIGNDWKLECRFEDQWAGHWKKYIAHTARYLPATAEGEALAISIPGSEAAVIRHFQERMPYGLFVPDIP